VQRERKPKKTYSDTGFYLDSIFYYHLNLIFLIFYIGRRWFWWRAVWKK